nr:hypothetical protein [Tanacetum cinerariifolium]
MVRDIVHLETAVNTITHEYLLEFTSEYGISEVLRPELPGPEDRIVDFPDEVLRPELPGPEDRIVDFPDEMDLFSLIHAPNPTKVKTGSRPCAPHELPLLTLTAPRIIKMDEPAAATDSSGVPSTIERSPLDFAHEAEASGRETAAPEMPPPEEVPITTAPGTD